MTTLAGWVFPTPDEATSALRMLARLSRDRLVNVDDAITVLWPVASTAPMVRSMPQLVGPGVFGMPFWHVLLGVVFVLPRLHGTPVGCEDRCDELLAGAGIDASFVRRLRGEIAVGSSALIAVAPTRAMDEISNALRGHTSLVRADLGSQGVAHLRDAFVETHV